MRHLLAVFTLSLATLAGIAQAADEPISGDTEIVIKAGEHQTVTEYKIHGITYAIKVAKKGSKPYYLVKADGDNFIRTDGSEMLIPSWKIFEWH